MQQYAAILKLYLDSDNDKFCEAYSQLPSSEVNAFLAYAAEVSTKEIVSAMMEYYQKWHYSKRTLISVANDEFVATIKSFFDPSDGVAWLSKKTNLAPLLYLTYIIASLILVIWLSIGTLITFLILMCFWAASLFWTYYFFLAWEKT